MQLERIICILHVHFITIAATFHRGHITPSNMHYFLVHDCGVVHSGHSDYRIFLTHRDVSRRAEEEVNNNREEGCEESIARRQRGQQGKGQACKTSKHHQTESALFVKGKIHMHV